MSITGDIRQVVLASGNNGKLAELQNMLSGLNINMRAQSEFGIGSDLPEADETGLTFVENAIIKARYAAKVSGMAAIADDSGIEVDYLQGQPGIYSARYAGTGASDADNNQKLLASLDGVKTPERTARFHSVLVYLRHADDPTPIICHGSWEGFVLEEIRGEHGFGYDPLFFVPSEHCSAAELPAGMKNKISHRAMAMKILLEKLQEMMR